MLCRFRKSWALWSARWRTALRSSSLTDLRRSWTPTRFLCWAAELLPSAALITSCCRRPKACMQDCGDASTEPPWTTRPRRSTIRRKIIIIIITHRHRRNRNLRSTSLSSFWEFHLVVSNSVRENLCSRLKKHKIRCWNNHQIKWRSVGPVWLLLA